MGSNLGLTQLCLNGTFDYSATSLIVHANQVYYPAMGSIALRDMKNPREEAQLPRKIQNGFPVSCLYD